MLKSMDVDKFIDLKKKHQHTVDNNLSPSDEEV